MIVKPPLWLATPRMRPLTFAPPSVMNNSPQAQAKVEREALAILREMDGYFGHEKFDEFVHEITKGRKRHKPDEVLTALISAEWDLAQANGGMTRKKFCRELGKKHPGQYRLQSPGAVLQRLRRLLRARQRHDREFQQALQVRGRSLLSKAKVT